MGLLQAGAQAGLRQIACASEQRSLSLAAFQLDSLPAAAYGLSFLVTQKKLGYN